MLNAFFVNKIPIYTTTPPTLAAAVDVRACVLMCASFTVLIKKVFFQRRTTATRTRAAAEERAWYHIRACARVSVRVRLGLCASLDSLRALSYTHAHMRMSSFSRVILPISFR